MVICFKCDARTKALLEEILASGSYRDHSEIILAAIASFATLHAELEERAVVVIDHANPAKVHADPSKQRRSTTGRPTLVTTPPNTLRRPPQVSRNMDAFAPMPGDVFTRGQDVPLDRWLFGQYSKLLPVKTSVRALANLEMAGRLESFASQIAVEAAVFAEYLRSLDQRLGLQRDDALSVGFPSNEENADKSRLRFANQYVGSMSKQGVLSGALIDFKFINSTSSRNGKISLTLAGWNFAMLENPVLDTTEPAGHKFSEVERSFLLDHITQSVPAEAFAFRAIIRGILGGATTPDALDDVVRAYVPALKKETITKPFITTQRSGAISRMSDLGLVNRVRDGVRVSYVTTEAGRTFIERVAA